MRAIYFAVYHVSKEPWEDSGRGVLFFSVKGGNPTALSGHGQSHRCCQSRRGVELNLIR